MIKKISVILLSLILSGIVAAAVAVGVITHKDNGGQTQEPPSGEVTDGTADGTEKPDEEDKTDKPDENDKEENGGGNNGQGGVTVHTCKFVFSEKVECCTTQGYNLFVCECGKSEKRDFFAPSGHDYKVGVKHPATCTQDWYMATECTRCGDTKDKQVAAGTKLPHNFGNYVSNNDATCGQDGTKTGACVDCGEIDTISDEGSATGEHVYGEYKSNNDGTCLKDGTKTAVCAICGGRDTVTVPDSKTDHSYRWTIITDTCSEIEKKGECTVCGDITIEQTIIHDAVHNYNWTEICKATCTLEGLSKGTCGKCGYSVNTEIPALGHKPDGNNKCTVCGEAVGVCGNKIYVLDEDGESEFFGTVYFEIVVINPLYRQKDNGLWVMKFDLYFVQIYTENGVEKVVRKKVVLDRPDDIGSGFTVTVRRISDNSDVTFNSVVDYTVSETYRNISVMVGGRGSINGIDYDFSENTDCNF